VPTVAELVVAEELTPLAQVVAQRGWRLAMMNATTFVLVLPAKDGSTVQLLVECDNYPVLPPAWHFQNPDTGEIDHPPDIPRGGSFFHSSGGICAPWNRLAYTPNGPHSNWDISDWKANPKTCETKTLCAMALRIAVELRGAYAGRLG
jgi:hypothetical protein